jgi:hypothetical protein
MGLRIYLSAIPAFVIGVGSSDYTEFTKDNVNSFICMDKEASALTFSFCRSTLDTITGLLMYSKMNNPLLARFM